MNRRGFIRISVLATAVGLTSPLMILSAMAQNQGNTDLQLPPRDPPWMSQLTDDQKTEIQQLIQSMKDSGATPQEIGDAINAKLQKWGIQIPERPTDPGREPPWMSQLTDDQKAQIQRLVQSMRDSGASPQEIGDAVNAKLKEWGIQIPEPRGEQPADSTQPPRDPPWMSQLTDNQQTQIQQLIQSMKDSGAAPQKIRDAIDAKLEEWGIELPAPPQKPGP